MSQVRARPMSPEQSIYLSRRNLRCRDCYWHISCLRICLMTVQTKDFIDVAARSQELGCQVPVRIALLPGNFATAANPGEFCFHAATPYVRSAWQSVGLVDEGPGSESRTGVGHDRNSPGIPDRVPSGNESASVPLVAFFGADLQTSPEWRLTVALGMVSRVLALHPSCASPWEVRFDAVVERPSGGYVCMEYLGDAYGIVALCRDLRRTWAVIPIDRSIPSSRAPGTSVVHADSEAQMALGLAKSETRSAG
jgi:hypothetical protein